MINMEHFNLYYEYKGSFEAFARDFFDVETTHDMTTKIVDYIGHEDIAVAHICWNLIFSTVNTFMVMTPTVRMAHYWSFMISSAMKRLPEYLHPGIVRDVHDEITTKNYSTVKFRPCDVNSCRGMTINTMYIIEPGMLTPRVYDEFMQSVLPTMTAGRKERQVIMQSRGY